MSLSSKTNSKWLEATHLDLFSGIGGFALAAGWAGFQTVCFCETNRFCQRVLARNFGAVRLVPDIRRLNGAEFRGVSLVTGGFPCQPFSVAGLRRGASDDRALWHEMFRVIAEARPAWVLGENVPGIIPMELDNVLSQLEGIGYATRAFVIPACAVDARHRRDRAWIVGRNMADTDKGGIRCAGSQGNQRHAALCCEDVSDSNEQGSQGWDVEELPERASERVTRASDSSLPNSDGTGLQERERQCGAGIQRTGAADREKCAGGFPQSRLGGVAARLPSGLDGSYCRWESEPDIPRLATGVKDRVNRLKGLGNAIVPQVAYEILCGIRKLI